MTAPRKRRSPGGNRGHAQAELRRARRDYRNTGPDARLPSNWRDRLPEPSAYYGQRVEKLGRPNGEGWAQGRCPFHEDRHESLSVNLGGARGGWRCFAGCGSGDLVSFHERITGRPFKDAVRELLAVGA